jgi:putative transposase
MNLHLAEISRHITPGAHAVVLLDGAGWHKTGRQLRFPDNISLLRLPPYSPELNPVENIWQFLRQNFLSNRIYDSYDAIVVACCAAWNALPAMPERIQSIAHRHWVTTVTA